MLSVVDPLSSRCCHSETGYDKGLKSCDFALEMDMVRCAPAQPQID